MCVCVCACVGARDRESDREREQARTLRDLSGEQCKDMRRERQSQSLCVRERECVKERANVCVRESESEGTDCMHDIPGGGMETSERQSSGTDMVTTSQTCVVFFGRDSVQNQSRGKNPWQN